MIRKGALNTVFQVLLAMLLLSACGDSVNHGGKTPYIGVGDEYLYKEDLEQAYMSQGMLSSGRIRKGKRLCDNPALLL